MGDENKIWLEELESEETEELRKSDKYGFKTLLKKLCKEFRRG